MKKVFILPAAMLLFQTAFAQTFTRINTGTIATDANNSFNAAWSDINNDKYLDMFVCNVNGQNDCLYQNNGNGTFTKITNGPLVNEAGFNECGTWADYDNDGDMDVFVTTVGANNVLYQNNGGTFASVGSAPFTTDVASSVGAAWGDYDNDGYVDLFVSNYGQNNFLYRNNGNGTFTKITTGQIVNDGGNSVGCSWGDYDNDGDLDLFVANYSGQNDFLYRNDGGGNFTKITSGPVVSDGVSTHGGSWGDYDNDGDLDLFTTNGETSNPINNNLYRNDGGGSFTKIVSGSIVSSGGTSTGSTWGDFDNDGDIDLFVSNTSAQGSGQNNFYYLNNGNGTFTAVTAVNLVTDGGDSRGAASGDYDNDGDLDLFVSNELGQTNFLYQNNGNSNSWINMKLIGTLSNKTAIGARVRAKATIGGVPTWQYQQVSSQTGYCAQNSVFVEFGFGNATLIDSIEIKWPSGQVCILTNVSVNQFVDIIENCTMVSVAELTGGSLITLSSVYPNPFSSELNIHYSLSEPALVTFTVVDMLGNELCLLSEHQDKGEHLKRMATLVLAPGVYVYTIRAGNTVQRGRLVHID
ncbi:MAG: FG-GAP-like repeat-containing protein [Bacteroidota bacterium]